MATKSKAAPAAKKTGGKLPIATKRTPARAAEPEPAVEVKPFVMPEYQSHKKVRAAKITAVRSDWAAQGVAVEGNDALLEMGEAWMSRHVPQLGGYLVEYADGYRSFSPAEAFEGGHTPTGN